MPVVAERLSLPDSVRDFDPTPYLSPIFERLFLNPDLFLKSAEEMPPPIKIRGTASRHELLKVFGRWDLLNRLFICKSSAVDEADRCELFAVAKDDSKDRQILHRKRRNLREKHVVGASRDLPHAVLLCQLPLKINQIAVCSVDDVKDFYHAYAASEARAKSSPVGPFFRFQEVSHLKACQEAVLSGRISSGDKVACCFKGLGMGDHAAVDIAQESHVNLIKTFGGLLDDEMMIYRRRLLVPVSRFYEGVMIDDHLGVQILNWQGSLKQTLSQPARDQEAFTAANRAYEHGNLEAHEKKRQRWATHVKVWGAEIEGLQGLVGPVRARLKRLAQLSVSAASPGAIDQKVLESITGLWAFCAQFRRPMFSFLYELYHQQSPGSTHEAFRISRGARNELLVLACLAPLCITDITAQPDPFLYCVDASPSGAGGCRAWVGQTIAQELWRRGDKLGYRIPLLTKLAACLKGGGLDEDLLHSDSESSDNPEGSEANSENFPDPACKWIGFFGERFERSPGKS